MANFVDFTPLTALFGFIFGSIRTAVSNTQNPTHTHSRLSAAHTITMSLFYQTITVRQYPALTSVRAGDSESLCYARPGVETLN